MKLCTLFAIFFILYCHDGFAEWQLFSPSAKNVFIVRSRNEAINQSSEATITRNREATDLQHSEIPTLYVGRGKAFDWNGWDSDCKLVVEIESTYYDLIYHRLDIYCGALSKTNRSVKMKKVGNTLVDQNSVVVGQWSDVRVDFYVDQKSYDVREMISMIQRIGHIDYQEDWMNQSGSEWYFRMNGQMSEFEP